MSVIDKSADNALEYQSSDHEKQPSWFLIHSLYSLSQ